MYLALERYSRPTTPEECLGLLSEPDQTAALLAGGTELNVRAHEAITHVIDLQALPFKQVKVEGETLRIGALVTLARLRGEKALRGDLLAGLREAAAGYAVLALQGRSTVGGRVYVPRSDQDLPPVLAALGARLRLLRLGSSGVEEQVVDYPLNAAAREVLQGALLAEVLIPLQPGGRSAYRRFGRTAVDVPLANGAAAVRSGHVGLAANVQGPGADSLRSLPETAALVGSWNGERPVDWRAKARQSLLAELAGYEDPWAGAAYRRDLAATLVLRSLAVALGEDEIGEGLQ